jgi:hypothetical protein
MTRILLPYGMPDGGSVVLVGSIAGGIGTKGYDAGGNLVAFARQLRICAAPAVSLSSIPSPGLSYLEDEPARTIASIREQHLRYCPPKSPVAADSTTPHSHSIVLFYPKVLL